MFKMWILTIIAAIVAYEVVKHLVQLFMHARLRYSMFILFTSVLYSHYYAWWGYINAYNDDFYSQWYHQALFSITELVSTVSVVYLCSKDNAIKPRLLIVIISIAVFHILASGADQFIENVVQGKGAWHQFLRDLGFMIPDMMHIAISCVVLSKHARLSGYTATQLIAGSDIIIAIISTFSLWAVCSWLWNLLFFLPVYMYIYLHEHILIIYSI